MVVTPHQGVVPHISLLCVGSELLRGKVNTHASHIALGLQKIGLSLGSERTVSDRPNELSAAVAQALQSCDALLITGGLGPTFDDLTREAVSLVTGRPLQSDPRLVRWLKDRFRRLKFRMTLNNLRQTEVLDGARVLWNKVGTAPGQILGHEGQILILLPGPYREMWPMFERDILPFLRKRFVRDAVETREYHWIGLAESRVDELLRPILRAFPAFDSTILADLGQVDLYVTARGPKRCELLRVLNQFDRRLSGPLRDALYSRSERGIEKAIGALLKSRRQTLAIAESCTGGMLGETLTRVPGSSRYFLGGVTAYGNAVKQKTLGVSPDLLKKHGAVSNACAQVMASEVRRAFGADWALSITGVAGPTGGTKQKPVGTVWIGLAGPSGRVLAKTLLFKGDRDAIRRRAVIKAMELLWEALKRKLA